MRKLFEGIVEFQKNDFEDHRLLFEDIGRVQNPHTLFIGCSDSRVVPNMITRTLPGELFVIRNIANIVPLYRETEEYVATTSAIEYAVNILHVDNIVVCGHSNCGGCAALFQPDSFFSTIPHTKKWLEQAMPVKRRVLDVISENDSGAVEWLMEQMNIVEQMKHLLSYPFIRARYENATIHIYGWYYIIETGEIFNYNVESKLFEKVE
jgi:carbonic anhydrase